MATLPWQPSVRIAVYLIWAAGLALFVALIAYEGFAEVMSAVAVAGWGLLLVAVFHLVPITADTMAWRGLMGGGRRQSFISLLWIRWIGESVNALLPVARVGGDLIRARLITQRGLHGAVAGASVVVDVTVGLLTQILFSLMGIGLLLQQYGPSETAAGLMVGISVFAGLLLAFYAGQRLGLFALLARVFARLAGGRMPLTLSGGMAALDEAIATIYRRRRDVAVSCGWRLVGWVLGTGEVWLALYFLGHPVSLVEAVFLESLVQAVRSAAFAVPGALGIQEGGLILLGQAIGLGPEAALALSLVKRIRELVLGGPGLLAWQIAEGRHLWRREAAGRKTGDPDTAAGAVPARRPHADGAHTNPGEQPRSPVPPLISRRKGMPAATDPPWDQRLARVLVRPLAGTGVTPNQVTTLSLILALAAGALFAWGQAAAAHWAAGLFMLARLVDHMDGELARCTGQASRFGHVYDTITGTLSYAAVFVGIGVGLALDGVGAWVVPLAIAAALATGMNAALQLRMELIGGPPSTPYPRFGPVELEDGIYLIGPFTWLGGLEPFFVIASLGTLAFCLWTVWTFLRKRAAGRATTGR
ncbi:MAG: flippase-like domain-containing protein [Alphaproteobacteria bacterium]